jgi:AbrB family looped-hinge helix DNA binding protein
MKMGTPTDLTSKEVKVTDKGQVSIPVEVQRKMGTSRGDELFLIAKGERIVLEKLREIDRTPGGRVLRPAGGNRRSAQGPFG